MLKIDPQTLSHQDLYQFMIGSIAPRPIAFVSTLDAEGRPNLAPYSFFNAISANPPLIAFSVARRMSDGSTKDTLENVEATRECVINVVSHDIVRQMTLTGVNYPKGVSEFEKSGLTPLSSELVKPFRVKESPVQMECQVEQILAFGTEGGAGNLVVCRIVRMHISEAVLDAEKKRIEPNKIDLVGRLGRAFYTRASGAALFDIVQPERPLALGYDALPASIRNSEVLTANNIARIAALYAFPTEAEVLTVKKDIDVQKALFSPKSTHSLHLLAQNALNQGDIELGAKLAFLSEYL